MRCKYPERDLSQRLDSTICRYKGFPYFVRVTGRLLSLYHLSKINKLKSLSDDNPALVINPNDELFDISTVPLGYFQSGKQVIYASRRPQRIYKQGLSSDSITFRGLNDTNAVGSIFSKQFESMILGDYPSLNHALESLKIEKEIAVEIAISRDVALKLNPQLRTIRVFYKNEEMGWLMEGTDIVVVPSVEKGWIISLYLSYFNWKIQ